MTRRLIAICTLTAAAVLHGQTQPCLENGRCPPIGCAQKGTPEAEANIVRKTRPPQRNPVIAVTIDHFEALQLAANNVGIQGFAIAVGKRDDYRHFKVLGKDLGEGNLVSLQGFIVGLPHARRIDSANCKQVGRAHNSYVFHLAPLSDDSEFDSVIAEMIPQERNPNWTLEKLRRIANEKRPVIVSGQLFYDSKHLVNSDPDEDLPGHPKRLSLWEIHPVTGVRVCNREVNELDDCDRQRAEYWPALERLEFKP